MRRHCFVSVIISIYYCCCFIIMHHNSRSIVSVIISFYCFCCLFLPLLILIGQCFSNHFILLLLLPFLLILLKEKGQSFSNHLFYLLSPKFYLPLAFTINYRLSTINFLPVIISFYNYCWGHEFILHLIFLFQ